MQKQSVYRALAQLLSAKSTWILCSLILVSLTGCTKMRPNVKNLMDENFQSTWPANSAPTIDTERPEFQQDPVSAKLDQLTELESTAMQPNATQSAGSQHSAASIQPLKSTMNREAVNSDQLTLPATTEPPAQVMNQPLRPLVFDPAKRDLTESENLGSLRNEDEKVIVLTAQPKSLSPSPSKSMTAQNKFVIEDFAEQSGQPDLPETPALSAAIQPDEMPANEFDPPAVAIQRSAAIPPSLQALQPEPNVKGSDLDFVQQANFQTTDPAAESEHANQFNPLPMNGNAAVPQALVPISANHSCPTCKEDCVCPLIDENAFVLNPPTQLESTAVAELPTPNAPPVLPEPEMNGQSWLGAEMPTPPQVDAVTEYHGDTHKISPVQEQENSFPMTHFGGQVHSESIQQAVAIEESLPQPELRLGLTPAEISELETMAIEFINSDSAKPVDKEAIQPVPEPHEQPKDWRSHLHTKIELLQGQVDNAENVQTRTGYEIDLRLLKILERRATGLDYARLSPQLNQYWNYQTRALTSMLDSTGGGSSDIARHRDAITTLDNLRNAVQQLETIASLRLVRPALCTEVSGYGQIKPIADSVFGTGQKFLLYCEVENFTSTQKTTSAGNAFHTRLRASVVIYDQSGNAVQQAEFPTVEDVASNRRRDFYMYMPVTIGSLRPGQYKLHLLVDDVDGNKTASLSEPVNISVR